MSSTLCRHILNIILYYTCFMQRPEKKNVYCFIIPYCIYSKQGSLQNPKLSILSSLAAQQHLAILLSPVAPVLNIGVEVMHRALLGIQTHISCVHSQPSYPQSHLSSSYSTVFTRIWVCPILWGQVWNFPLGTSWLSQKVSSFWASWLLYIGIRDAHLVSINSHYCFSWCCSVSQ